MEKLYEFIWDAALESQLGTSPEPQHGREPDKVKPLAQYLDEFFEHEVELDNITKVDVLNSTYNSWRELLEQALDAYQLTENVTIKIERV